MTKQEYIEKYGVARYERLQEMNRERRNGTLEEWKEENGFLPCGWKAHSDERKVEIVEKMKKAHRASDKYKQCEGKHQCEDHEQWKRYMREYRRQYYLEHKDEIIENNRKYLERKKANGGKLNTRRGRRTNEERRTTLTADEVEQIRYGHTLEEWKADIERAIEDYSRRCCDDYINS